MAGNVFLSILFPPSSVLFRPDAEEVVSHLCVFFFCPFLSIGLGSMAAMMAETTPPRSPCKRYPGGRKDKELHLSGWALLVWYR